MRYSKIDRFSESHEATLANITVMLYLDNGYAYLWKAQHGLIKEDL